MATKIDGENIDKIMEELKNDTDSFFQNLPIYAVTLSADSFFTLIKVIMERDELKRKIKNCFVLFQNVGDDEIRGKLLKIFLKDDFLCEELVNAEYFYQYIDEYIPSLLLDEEILEIIANNEKIRNWIKSWVINFMTDMRYQNIEELLALEIALREREKLGLSGDKSFEENFKEYGFWLIFFTSVIKNLKKQRDKIIEELKTEYGDEDFLRNDWRFDSNKIYLKNKQKLDFVKRIIKWNEVSEFFLSERFKELIQMIFFQSKSQREEQQILLIANRERFPGEEYKLIGAGYYRNGIKMWQICSQTWI